MDHYIIMQWVVKTEACAGTRSSREEVFPKERISGLGFKVYIDGQ